MADEGHLEHRLVIIGGEGPRKDPHIQAFGSFLDEFNKETQRGAALAGTAYIDDLLGNILQAFLIKNESAEALLTGFNAPLGTLSARIAAAQAMGLISDQERRECDLLRKIRNEFAHKVQMSFEHARVKGLCAGLKFAGKAHGDLKLDGRNRFTMSAVTMIISLMSRPQQAKAKELKLEAWQD